MPIVRSIAGRAKAPAETRKASENTASAKRDAAFLQRRRAVEAANLKRTLELRTQRLAHQEALKASAGKK